MYTSTATVGEGRGTNMIHHTSLASAVVLVTMMATVSLFPNFCSAFSTLSAPFLLTRSSIQNNLVVAVNMKRHRTTTTSLLFGTNSEGYDDNSNEGEDEDVDVDRTIVQDLFLSGSGTEAHALEVFSRFSSGGLYEGQKYITQSEALYQILCCLDIEATEEDAEIVFKYLNSAGDGRLLFNNDFFPWYIAAHEAAEEVTEGFQSLIVGRRSIEKFDKTPVDDNVLYRAIQCAISAPNRSCTEPWRFICVGPQTVSKFAKLNARLTNNADTTEEEGKLAIEYVDWTNAAPGWCVVTTKTCSNTDDDGRSSGGADSNIDLPSTVDAEDYKSVCCAIQNFMLSIWSEGIGTKWTTGPVQKTKEFADLCGIDFNEERVAGIIWYGYAAGGTRYADPRRRQLTVADVLTNLP
mmetsp:Transcript_30959/g.35551  ORF Transcript_30959/g.35551 Transcript_30959/m.35551 type:complete len:407 (-) Transcript_30959:463-1683(-)